MEKEISKNINALEIYHTEKTGHNEGKTYDPR